MPKPGNNPLKAIPKKDRKKEEKKEEPKQEAKKEFKRHSFPKPVKCILNEFFKLTAQIKRKFPNLPITVDMTEGKSFLEYNKFGFKIYNKDNAYPVAIGGDYITSG